MQNTATLPTQVTLIGAPTDIGAGARRLDGPRSAARGRHRPRHRGAGLPGHRSRQSLRPGQSVATARRRLSSPGRSDRLEPGRARCHVPGPDAGRVAHSAGRRPLPGHRLDQRGGAPLPRRGQEIARAVAGRAHRLQHQRPDADRQHPRHAGGLPVRPWPGPDHRHVGPDARHRSVVGAPDRHPQRRRGRKTPGAPGRPGGVRHALPGRNGHARNDGSGVGRAG